MRADNLKFQVKCRDVEYVAICVANMRYYFLLDEEEEVDQQPPSTSTHSERTVNNHHPENGNTKDIDGIGRDPIVEIDREMESQHRNCGVSRVVSSGCIDGGSIMTFR